MVLSRRSRSVRCQVGHTRKGEKADFLLPPPTGLGHSALPDEQQRLLSFTTWVGKNVRVADPHTPAAWNAPGMQRPLPLNPCPEPWREFLGAPGPRTATSATGSLALVALALRLGPLWVMNELISERGIMVRDHQRVVILKICKGLPNVTWAPEPPTLPAPPQAHP